MTTTLGQLADAQAAIDAILALPLPAVTAWKVTKLAQEVIVHTASFFEQRGKAVQRYGVADEARPGYFTFNPQNGALYDAEIAELRAVSIEVKSPLISLKSLGAHQVTGSQLLALGPLLIDDAD